MKKEDKYNSILKLDSISFNDYMQAIESSDEAEDLLVYLLSISKKHRNKTKIYRVYSRMSFLRRNEELEMMNEREWYK